MDLFLREAAERIGDGDVLSKVDALMDWRAFGPILNRGLARSGIGPQGYDPLVLFKDLLIGQWHSLSAPKLERALKVRLHFLLFCGLVEVQNYPREVRIFEDGQLIACHPVLEGKTRRRVETPHIARLRLPAVHPRHWQGCRAAPLPSTTQSADASPRTEAMSEILERVRGALVGLKMPRALEALDHTMQQLEKGEITQGRSLVSRLARDIPEPSEDDRDCTILR